MERDDMRADAELLNAMLNDAPLIHLDDGATVALSAKLIAHWTDRATQTISDYRTGKLNIPVDFWRALLSHYFDMRIVQLILPGGYSAEVHSHGEYIPLTGPQWFREAILAEREHHEQSMYLADILADGRVDETDAQTIKGYDDAFHAHRHREALLHRAILTAYRRNQLARSPAK